MNEEKIRTDVICVKKKIRTNIILGTGHIPEYVFTFDYDAMERARKIQEKEYKIPNLIAIGICIITTIAYCIIVSIISPSIIFSFFLGAPLGIFIPAIYEKCQHYIWLKHFRGKYGVDETSW